MATEGKGLINGVYNLGAELGRSEFSTVYLATDNHGKQYAVKTENRVKQNALIKEREVFTKLCKNAEKMKVYPIGFPRLYHFDEDFHGDRVVVMDRLGKSVATLLSERGTHFSIKTVLMIGIQVVIRLEYLHGMGIIHRDIKPENLLTGVGEQRGLIYLTNYGLAYDYIDWMGQHKGMCSARGFFGTHLYASMQAHKQRRQSRRSDLESLAYTLVYLAQKRLPWMSVNKKDEEAYAREVARIKRNTSPEVICRSLPDAFTDFLQYVKDLGHTQKPNYGFLQDTLSEGIWDRGEKIDNQFDWLQE